MLIPNHPGDESLSSLASREPEATADQALTSHVDACARCTDLVNELGALHLSLGELPDLRPSRPLQLVPPVDEPATSDAGASAGGWIRRLFAPAMTAGAALALVGVVGTAAPTFEGMAAGGGDSAQEMMEGVGNELRGGGEPAAAEESAADGRGGVAEAPEPTVESDRTNSTFDAELPAERSPWPMVLFTGVAVIVGALLLRWILVPRAP